MGFSPFAMICAQIMFFVMGIFPDLQFYYIIYKCLFQEIFGKFILIYRS